MKLSVIIPCFNAGATLAVQLEALSKQTYSKLWELILADNGSADNTLKVANQFKNRFHAFKIVDASARRGSAYARNIGICAAASEKFACCDADDEVSENWVEAMVNSLNDHKIVCGKFRFDKFNDPIVAERISKRWKGGLTQKDFLPGGGAGNFGSNKRVHMSIGGFDEHLLHGQDADYFWRLQLAGFKLHYEPNAIVQVRVGRVNPSFVYMYQKARNRASCNYWCYKKYRNYGMRPPPPIKKTIREWVKELKSGLRIVTKHDYENKDWQLKLAQKTGTLVGDLKGRLTNPCKPFVPSKMIE